MSLDKLVGISLEKVEPDPASIARRNTADATIMAVSSENRFDAAYKGESLYRCRTAGSTR